MALRFLSVFALVTLFTLQAPVPTFAQQHHVMRVAPADEYFGRLKMSILGVRNELRDLAVRLASPPARAHDFLGTAALVEDAIRDWERKYPADPWLAKNVYDLSQIYGRIPTDEARQRANATLQWLIVRYPHSPFATIARAQLK